VVAVVPAVPSVPPSDTSDIAPMSFSGSPGEFFKLLFAGSLLLIPTLGFYRFWLITDIRRHLWANTRIGDESFEYTGTGKELLIGFLIALAILAPFYIAYFIVGLAAETLQAFASIPFVLILYGFGQYALFRARRYRATRTIFRGVRFWMTGSPWSYAGRALLWDLGTVLTLGLLLPWRTAALERYKMRHTRFGDLTGDFVATGGTFFRRGWWLWGSTLALPVIISVTAPFGAILILAYPFIYVGFRAIQLCWHMEGLRFGPVATASHLGAGAVFGCYFRTFGVMLAYALVIGGVLSGIYLDFGSSLLTAEAAEAWTPATIAVIAALALTYLVLLIGIGVIKRYFLDRGLWVAIAATTTLANTAALDAVVAKGDVAGSVGEGLADALDVGGF
jgi:uncharacterized membrane protein YjgN (DUF898 family)